MSASEGGGIDDNKGDFPRLQPRANGGGAAMRDGGFTSTQSKGGPDAMGHVSRQE